MRYYVLIPMAERCEVAAAALSSWSRVFLDPPDTCSSRDDLPDPWHIRRVHVSYRDGTRQHDCLLCAEHAPEAR
jgi:hypothetical protein